MRTADTHTHKLRACGCSHCIWRQATTGAALKSVHSCVSRATRVFELEARCAERQNMHRAALSCYQSGSDTVCTNICIWVFSQLGSAANCASVVPTLVHRHNRHSHRAQARHMYLPARPWCLSSPGTRATHYCCHYCYESGASTCQRGPDFLELFLLAPRAARAPHSRAAATLPDPVTHTSILGNSIFGSTLDACWSCSAPGSRVGIDPSVAQSSSSGRSLWQVARASG